MEENRLRVFDSRVLRGMFGRKRKEVTEKWRKLHNEELNGLYSTENIIRVRWAGHVARTKERRGVYMVLVGTPEGKGQLGRPSCRRG